MQGAALVAVRNAIRCADGHKGRTLQSVNAPP
jgi:hypothetical protein